MNAVFGLFCQQEALLYAQRLIEAQIGLSLLLFNTHTHRPIAVIELATMHLIVFVFAIRLPIGSDVDCSSEFIKKLAHTT